MNAQPAVVGLTLNWRDASRTAACLRSLLSQDIAHVLVWDNSADGGHSASELARTVGADPRVTIVQSPANLGFAAGVNRGLAWLAGHFPGTWVLLINNDAILLPGAVPSLCSALLSNPAARLAYPNIDHGGRVCGPAYYHRPTGLLGQHSVPGSFPYASGCCLLIAADRLAAPLFDEDFLMYGEDWELGWRFRQIPGALLHVPETLVFHEGSASSGLGSPFYETRMVAAHWICARKLARNRVERGLFLAGRAAVLPARALVRAWRYRSWVPIVALWQGWRLAQAVGRISPA